MSESVLVVGAGIAGLCTALALGPTGRQVTLVERDASPPEGDADAAFRDWKRTGVGHLRQSHAFLARLSLLLKADHPQLLKELADFGVRELPFDAMLTESQRKDYRPEPTDADLTIITSRRTTLELVMRRYVETLPNVSIRSGVFTRRLLTQKAEDGTLTVVGLEGETAEGPIELRADMVVDAAGKGGDFVGQLTEEGATVRETSESAGILYFTRHYRLKPGCSEPPRIGNPPASGDLGFLKFGVFPADNGCFSITMCAPEIEYEIRKAIVNPDIFQAMTTMIPGLRPWTDPAISEPTTKVFGMGDLQARWRDLVVDGKPAALGYFAIGDNLIRTNPLYGRGCSFAAVAAWQLRDVLNGAKDPAERALRYHDAIQTELLPFYAGMNRQDRTALKRAKAALTPGYKPSFKSRLAQSFAEDAVTIALRSDTSLLRQGMRGFHMLEHPEAWIKRPANLARIMMYWARGKKRNAAAYPPKPGPDREEMMRGLGLDPQADIELLAMQKAA
ncbi:MAG: FAD-dependent oxidoreductase [Caulobacteraceae bacterium]|nr:FAD-dependent oxidoreductase [Caulobacteraceae bacterium]